MPIPPQGGIRRCIQMPEIAGSIPRCAEVPWEFRGYELYLAVARERQQMESCLAAILRELRAKRRRKALRWLLALWPVAAGIVAGAFAPGLYASAASGAPWITTVAFPFVLLANRPEVMILGELGSHLYAWMIPAQFPIEGLLAWMLLKQRGRLPGICGQVICFHALGALEIWLLGGGLAQIAASHW